MPATEIVRAWTDDDFRATLTSEDLAALPDHPAGSIDDELDQLLGAFDPASQEECITVFSRRPCCN